MLQRIAGAGAQIADYGDGNKVTIVPNDTAMVQYQKFIAKLEAEGYVLYVDNSATELAEFVKTATYVKEQNYFTVTHMIKAQKTYLSYCEDRELSSHLKYDNSYVTNNIRGAKTKLHNLEMFWFGNSLVIQLKNGHFIISDGGLENRGGLLSDAEYLMQYLEDLVPQGTKPVVDAWVISHLHSDHCGVFTDFVTEAIDANRLYVEGIYYNEPNDTIFDLDPFSKQVRDDVKKAAKLLQTTSGGHPARYRLQTGQRYYFNDITMDIVLAQEQMTRDNYVNVEFPEDPKKSNFNDSSTWCMFTIEGQKVLFMGDADKGGMDVVMDTYNKEYLTLTGVVVSHHSWNPYQVWVDYITVDAVIVPGGEFTTAEDEYVVNFCPERIQWYAQNSALEAKAKEVIAWGKGTVTMTFPYAPGNLEVKEKKQRKEES